MYDVFKLFPYSTRLEVYETDLVNKGNPCKRNPVELCMIVEHSESYCAANDHRDAGRLAKSLYAKHSQHTPDDSFGYAKTYDDYTAFLDDWEHGTVDVKKAMGLDVAENLTTIERMSLVQALDVAIFETFIEQRLEVGAGIYTINLLFKQLMETGTDG